MLQPLTITDEYLAKIAKLNEDILVALSLISNGQRELNEKLTEQSRKANDKGTRRG